MKKIRYSIYFPGEISAGLRSFSDEITVTVKSGDPGGDSTGEYSFQQQILESLKDWYDGATVEMTEVTDGEKAD